MINLIYNTNDDHILEHNLGVSYFESWLQVLSQGEIIHTRGDWKSVVIILW